MTAPALNVEQIFEMAVSALKRGEFEQASELCLVVLRRRPEHADAYHLRGICLLRMERPFDALLHFNQALSMEGCESRYDFWNNRGLAFSASGYFAAAEAAHRKSLELVEASEPHINLGGLYAHQMRLEESEAEYKAALAIEPTLQDVHVKLGVIQLSLGKWKEGFPEYGWRWFDTPLPVRPYRLFPHWKDLHGSAKDKTILLYSEQGFGDEILSLRFVQLVQAKLGRRVILEVRPTMLRLAKQLSREVIVTGDDYPPGIDCSCPLLDVPMVLGLTPETMPKPRAYIGPSYRRTTFDERISKLGPGLKVGLCWNAGRRILQPETERTARAKSCPLSLFEPLMSIQGVHFISLQVPPESLTGKFRRIHDWIGDGGDFADTADLISHLDLVISVDTAVAHLAGALGRPTWCLVRANGYWPWMLKTDGPKQPEQQPTPWYPSMSVYHQHTLGDWNPIIAQIREDLEQWIQLTNQPMKEAI